MVRGHVCSDHGCMETETNTPKIKRSRDDRMLGGVCGGIATHYDIDPVIVRIATIALVCAVGAGAVAYVAAWILMPLEERPEPVAPTDTREPLPA
jgi:phage shock protein C